MRHHPSRRRLPAAMLAAFIASLAMTALASPVSAATSSYEAEAMIVRWINRDRSAAGLAPLHRHHQLAVIAGRRATRMAHRNVLNHSVGGHLPSQLDARGVTWYHSGENVGYSHRTWTVAAARNLYQMWKRSPSHRRLMMSRDFNFIGVGLAYRSSAKRTFGSIVFTRSPR